MAVGCVLLYFCESSASVALSFEAWHHKKELADCDVRGIAPFVIDYVKRLV
jgi:hypothetical protein